jgi:predicted ATPase
MYAQWVHLFARAEHDVALGTAREMITFAARHGGTNTKCVAHYCMGATASCRGDCITARDHLERSLALDDPHQAQAVVAVTGRDNAVVTLIWLTEILSILGHAGKARVFAEEGIRRGNLLAHVPTMAFAQHGQMSLCVTLRDYTGAEKAADTILRLAREHNFPRFKPRGWIDFGWARAETGSIAEGIKAMRDGLIAWKNMGFQWFLPRHLSMLAGGHFKAGEAEEGLRVIGEALSVIESTSERLYEAEVFRLKGECCSLGTGRILTKLKPASSRPSKSRDIRVQRDGSCARRQVWRACGAIPVVRLKRVGVLAPVYDWFTEGFDLPDLKDAKALLDELTAAAPAITNSPSTCNDT